MTSITIKHKRNNLKYATGNKPKNNNKKKPKQMASKESVLRKYTFHKSKNNKKALS